MASEKTAAESRDWLVRELHRYVALQAALLGALTATYGDGSRTPSRVLETTRGGTVRIDRSAWRFYRHGGGVAFQDLATRTCVDVPDRCDEPSFFDEGRIQTFIGSLGPSAARHVARGAGREGAPLHECVPAMLERLVRDGQLVRDADGFQLAHAHAAS